MTNNKIEEISLDVKSFLARSSKLLKKINNIEEKVNKIQNYFLSTITSNNVNLEEKSAFDNFIRKGIEGELITKSFSGGADDGVRVHPGYVRDLNRRIQPTSNQTLSTLTRQL